MSNSFINNFISETTDIISSYCQYGSSEETFFLNSWKEIWKPDLEGDRFIGELLQKRVFVFSSKNLEEQLFYDLVHPMLIDMAKQPLERRFLATLSAVIQDKNAQIQVERARPPTPLLPFNSPLYSVGSYVADMSTSVSHPSGNGVITRISYKVGLCLSDHSPFLEMDDKGLWHWLPGPLHRVISHELTHVFHMVTGRSNRYLSSFPKTRRWSDGEELMTIAGQGITLNGDRYTEEFSENSFAKARGEYERLTHFTFPEFPSFSKKFQFYTSLNSGAMGSVQLFLDEFELGQRVESNLVKFKNSLSTEAQNGIKKKIGSLNLFDLNEISEEELVKWYMKPPSYEDRSDDFFAEVERNKKLAYKMVVIYLKKLGYQSKADHLENAMAQTNSA